MNLSKSDVEIMYKKFLPLIKKYSYYLNYEDAESDLTLKLVETLKRMPDIKEKSKVTTYIHVTIKNEYIRLNKIKYFQKNMFTHNNDIIYNVKNNNNDYSILELMLITEKLSILERKVIKDIYISEISCQQIAEKMKLSRQYINKVKNNALIKLKKMIT